MSGVILVKHLFWTFNFYFVTDFTNKINQFKNGFLMTGYLLRQVLHFRPPLLVFGRFLEPVL